MNKVEAHTWYEVVGSKDNILQGDFIEDCPVIIPPSVLHDEIEACVRNYNTVIMSQSCDLVQGKIDLVLMCPIWSLNELGEIQPYYKNRKGREALRRGHIPGYHLLNKCEIDDFETDFLVVDFRSVYSVSFNFVIDFVKKRERRLRLLSPHREHLSQAFARFFMRVGLPVDIPPFQESI